MPGFFMGLMKVLQRVHPQGKCRLSGRYRQQAGSYKCWVHPPMQVGCQAAIAVNRREGYRAGLISDNETSVNPLAPTPQTSTINQMENMSTSPSS